MRWTIIVNYINTLMKYKVDFKKRPRKLVVVLTKADTFIIYHLICVPTCSTIQFGRHSLAQPTLRHSASIDSPVPPAWLA